MLVEQVNSAEKAFAQGGAKPLLGVAAAFFVLLGAGGFALALERLIPRRSKRKAAAVAGPAAATLDTPLPADEPELIPLEVPTMTLATAVEEAAPGTNGKPKPAPRPRSKATKNGTAPRRRRTTTTTQRVAPTPDDAN